MNNSKNKRFILSIIFLFSVLLFMGTESTGCLDCDTENNASVTITNGSAAQQKVVIAGPTPKEVYIGVGQSSIAWVEPGEYVITSYAAPYYNSLYYSSGRILLLPSEAEILIID